MDPIGVRQACERRIGCHTITEIPEPVITYFVFIDAEILPLFVTTVFFASEIQSVFDTFGSDKVTSAMFNRKIHMRPLCQTLAGTFNGPARALQRPLKLALAALAWDATIEASRAACASFR